MNNVDRTVHVERIRRRYGMIEYRIVICSSHVVDELMDEKVPSRYIAAYVVNDLREFVELMTLDDTESVIEKPRASGEFTCPTCGSKVMR